ncbi:hypothetical protein PS893_00512 [Pseudomonas fluorescens]|nr:hypothetical protein PS893_00512 [Pseudomonas fluorescens]
MRDAFVRCCFTSLAHPGCQPSDLPANFGDEGGCQKTMGYGRLEPAQFRIAYIAVNGIVVARNLRELTNIIS